MASSIRTQSTELNNLNLFIVKCSSGGANTFGLNSGLSSFLKTKIQKQLELKGEDYEVFNKNFINYTEGRILCVNTEEDLIASNLFNTKVLNDFINTLAFTSVLMPEEFKELTPSEISSPYNYGERLLVGIKIEKIKSNGNNISKIVYRDLNVKARSKLGQSQGGVSSAIGVWS